MHKITNALYDLWFYLFLRRKPTREQPMLHPERLKDLEKNLHSHFLSSNNPFCVSFGSTGYWESVDYLQNKGWDIQLKAIGNDLYYVITESTYKAKYRMKI